MVVVVVVFVELMDTVTAGRYLYLRLHIWSVASQFCAKID